MIELIDSLIEAPPSKLSQKGKENLVVLRNRLKPLSRTLSDTYDAPNANQSNVSVMISYAWEVNKPYVEQLTKILKQSGIDVWRDEEGSSQITRMGGDIMEKMAEVVSLSSVFIVCLSEAYKRRPNCRSEGKLIRRKQIKGCRVYFIMMDSSFEDDVFDTWLGIMLGSDMWYPLWDSSQIFSTASALVQLISGQSRC